jgi:DNA (cytosine-5)-methyltransferase 1
VSGLIVDNFAGGGGASTGIEQALGRAVDIAINHDEQALAMHEANHPGTRHIRNNIWKVDPVDVCGGRPVELAWFSPDCKHFSKAKGGKPREKSIRDLAWVVVLWAKRVKPELILLENVEEFRTWGPLDHDGYPIKDRVGETFDLWCRELRRHGYKLQFRELRACDYGAPTIRKRFFMIARRDGLPIVWPAPTHGKPDSPEVLSGQRLPWRTAAEIIDWSIPCPSIFERKKELADATCRRIARGVVRYVLENPKPFIVPNNTNNVARGVDEPVPTVTTGNRNFVVVPKVAPFVSYAQQGGANRSAGEPLHTVTASQKDHNCIAAAHLVHIGNGEREGQVPRAMDAEKPLGTVVAGGAKHALVSAFLQKFTQNGNGSDPADPLHTVMAGAPRHAVVCAHLAQYNNDRGVSEHAGHPVDRPLSTISTKGPHQALVTSNLVKLRGTCADGQAVDEPLHTVSAGGSHFAEVRAFLLKYYGADQDPRLDEPLHTVTSRDRFGLVIVTVEGEEYAIIDIGMRMLTKREQFNAQGFPPDYIIDRDIHGNRITGTQQQAKCGNSVCPPVAQAIVSANAPSAGVLSGRAAA